VDPGERAVAIMAGERDLEKLFASISPTLTGEEYVFCTFECAKYGDYSDLEPIAAIEETEGLTLVLPKHRADHENLSYESVFRRITLNIHSSLDAVGLTAAFSNKLSESGISANVVAGFYHDHIFVQREFAENAVKALNEIAP